MSYRRHSLRILQRMLISFLVLSVVACVPGEEDAQAPTLVDFEDLAYDMLASGDVELVDLTYPLSPDSLYWPNGSPFEHDVTDWGMTEDGWYATAAFSSPEHLGTHLDAPIHFGESKWASADIPVERFISRGIVIDVTDKAEADADATLAVDDIAAWEQRNGAIPERSIVIVRTGWASRWPDWNAYYGSDTPEDVTTLHFPGVSTEAAQALVDRGIFGLGVDTASIDPGNNTTFEAHRILAPANIFNLENLTNVDGLPETGFGIIALPMKIEGGTGGPTRVLAVIVQ